MKKHKGEKGGGKVAASGKETGNEINKLVQAIGYLALETARESRDHGGILMQSCLVENTEQWAKDGLEEGRSFAELVKERPGENLGSPHIRVGLRSLETLINSTDAGQVFQSEMRKW